MWIMMVYGFGGRRVRRFKTKAEALRVGAELAANPDVEIVAVRRAKDAQLVWEYIRRPSGIDAALGLA